MNVLYHRIYPMSSLSFQVESDIVSLFICHDGDAVLDEDTAEFTPAEVTAVAKEANVSLAEF